MGWHRGMNIITDGLVSYYDTMNTKCFKTYNLLQYTEDFGNSIWSKTATSVITNVTTAPDGTLTADKVIANSSNIDHTIRYFNGSVSAGTYTFSCFFKKADYNYGYLNISNNIDYSIHCAYDLINGTVRPILMSGSSFVSSNGTMIYVGDGWWRCSFTFTTNATIANLRTDVVATNDSASFSWIGNGTSGTFLWGIQLNRGKRTLSYQPVLTTTPSPIITDLITKKNGILTNNPIFNAGDGEILFNGTNYIDTDFIGSNTDSYTVDVWCYVTSGNPFMRGSDSFGGWSCTIALTGFFVVVNGSLYGTSYVPISTNRWVNLVGVYSRDTGSIRFYLNGSFNGAGTCPVNGTLRNSTKGFLLANANSAYFTGKLGAFRVYNRVLSQDEVLQNYKSTKSRYL